MRQIFFFLVLSFCCLTVSSQKIKSATDSARIHTKILDSVIVSASYRVSSQTSLPDISDYAIFAGKRTNSLVLSSNNNNGSQLNLGRVLLSSIPGLTMWEMDGAGTQLNIGSRGTDPHRSIEMNMRQNGYNTNSDIFGYPENHYTVPMQAVEEVQLVRGSAALQFGPQFGGMMNYKLKEGDSIKSFAAETEQTAGSYNLFNSYNAAGGTKGKLRYYTFYDNRHGDGWRDNAKFSYHAYYAHIAYQVNNKVNIAAEFSRMDYVQQIAGGLTDEQYKVNSKQSVRARNYFQPVINIPAILFKYDISPHTHLQVILHGVFGERNSVQFINAGNIADTFNSSIGSYNPRQVDRDYYKGFTAEARVLHHYRAGKIKSVLSGGMRYFTERTNRRQKGIGTTGSDFDLSLTKSYGTDLHLTTRNYALFAENIFQLTSRLSITPGVRYEIIKTDLAGVINNATADIGYRSIRNFPLFGIGLQYQAGTTSQLYGNISQEYRPYLYANVTPADRLDKIDTSLKDSKGYCIDLGYRGHYKNVLQFDVTAFYLYYGNKIGLLTQTGAGGASYLFTTNIGNSVTKGIEVFGELSLMKLADPAKARFDIRIFNSLAYNDARYVSGSLNQSGANKKIEGNYVENAPVWVNKSGLRLKFRNVSFDFQYGFTSKMYNDAFNTGSSANGVIGEIPAYHIWDWGGSWQFLKQFRLSAGINNFTNEKYFNRRITMYPGPGILPADGRTFYISLGAKF